MSQYVPVAEDETEDPIEVPTEPDGTLLLSNLTAQFPGASGLRYRSPESNAVRAVKLVDGILHQPAELSSWCSSTNGTHIMYICTYAKDKRRIDADDMGGYQSKRNDPKRCTDLIVLGLPYKADEEQLREHFGQFGQVVMSQIKRDHDGSSKGYGFIRFRDYDSQSNCLSARHQIDGRRCEVKIPNSQADGCATAGLSKRVFVGRVTEDMTDVVLRDFFAQYGEVEEIYIPKPFRAFAFVTFTDPDTAASLIGQNCVISGVGVQIGPANPKQQTRSRYQGGSGAGGAGMAGDFAVAPPSMGGWGPPGHYGAGGAGGGGAGGGGGGGSGGSAPYQDVVNSLASNPQLLAAALQQAYQQPPAAGAGGPPVPPPPVPPLPEVQQQQQQQAAAAGHNASPHYGNYHQPYHQIDNSQYQHNGSYGYHHQHHQQQQWQ